MIGANACFEAMKLERRALISSTFDFSEAGRRVIDGPAFIMLLNMVSDCVISHLLKAPYEVERMSLVIMRFRRPFGSNGRTPNQSNGFVYFRPLLSSKRYRSVSVAGGAVP